MKNSFNRLANFFFVVVVSIGVFAFSMSAGALPLQVTIENLAPVGGNFLTPIWVGFHDGSFDLYDGGQPITPALEALVEDGNNAPISDLFQFTGSGTQDGTAPGPNGPIAPGDIATITIDVDPLSSGSQYFSFASMVLPSNDAFIANGNPTAYQVFDDVGNFLGVDIFVIGADVLDGGTEVNDELPMNTAFFGQMAPNTGVEQNGVVETHPGFLPAGSGGILDDPQFANADFTRAGYPIAQIRIQAIPLPPAAVLIFSGLIGGLSFARWHRREAIAA